MKLSENVKKVVINNDMKPYGRAHKDGTMEINIRRGDVVDTIIHENLHLKDWQMPHGEVYKTTDKLEGRMGLPDMARLLMETHARAQNPVYERQYTRTFASKVISSSVKNH